jgi:hypothetical protein
MNKQTLTILAIAAVLVTLLLVFENPFKSESPQPKSEQPAQLFVLLSEPECSRIELKGFLTSTTLVRQDRQWMTGEGFRADPEGIEELFRTVQEMKDPELISINPKAFLNFRVDPVTGTSLRMFDMQSKLKVDLIVGSIEGDIFHVPVRRSDSSNVYRVRGMLRNVLQRRTWRDRNILRLEPTSLRRIAVQRPDESYVVQRESAESPWHFSEPTSAPVDAQKAENWAQWIANLQAIEFEPTAKADMMTTFGLTKPQGRLLVLTDTGSSCTILFGNKNQKTNLYYTKRTDEPQVFLINDLVFNNILQKSNDLKPTSGTVTAPVPPPAPMPVAPEPPRMRPATKAAPTPSLPPAVLKTPPKPSPTSGTKVKAATKPLSKKK